MTSNSEKKYQIVKKVQRHQGYFNVTEYHLKHTLYKGGWSEEISREIFHRGNCVAVLLYDPDRDEVVIIEQIRIGTLQLTNQVDSWLLEIVAGGIEQGETPEEVAYRESEEEAGCTIKELHKINQFFTSPGGTSELLTLFYGRVDSTHIGGLHGLEHEDEDISVKAIKFDEVYQLLSDGKIISAIPIIAIQWLYINRDKLRSNKPL